MASVDVRQAEIGIVVVNDAIEERKRPGVRDAAAARRGDRIARNGAIHNRTRSLESKSSACIDVR